MQGKIDQLDASIANLSESVPVPVVDGMDKSDEAENADDVDGQQPSEPQPTADNGLEP